MDITLDSIKNIQLYQKKSGYRFNIDSILLAEYVNRIKPRNIVDLGAGNGVIGILLAEKYPSAKVLLVEIQKSLFDLCRRNIDLNNLQGRVTAYHCDVSHMNALELFAQHSFDVVVSNPPFRKPKSGKVSPYIEKAYARHEIKIDLDKLIDSTGYLLKPKGYFYIIFHPSRIVELLLKMKSVKIEPKRVRFIYSNVHSESKMALVEGIKAARSSVKIEKPLFIYNKYNTYSEELKKMLE